MNFASTQFVPSRRMGICEPLPQIGMWSDYKENNYLDTSTPAILEVDSRFDNQVQFVLFIICMHCLVFFGHMFINLCVIYVQSEDTSHGIVEPSNKYDQEVSKTNDKVKTVLLLLTFTWLDIVYSHINCYCFSLYKPFPFYLLVLE